MVRPATKNRNKTLPNARVSEEEYKLLCAAWHESGLPYADFILSLLKFYNRQNYSQSQMRRANRKKGK